MAPDHLTTRKPTILAGAVVLAWLAGCDWFDKDKFRPPTAPEDQFLRLETEGDRRELPADGFSTLKIIATITAEAASSKRTVRFVTTAGTFVDATASDKRQKDRVVDASGRAVVELRSEPRVTTAIVSASVTGEARASGSLEISLTAPAPDDIMKLETEGGATTLPADGVSRLKLTATLAPELPDRTVLFTNSGGTLVGGRQVSEGREVTADATGRAVIELQSSTQLLTAFVRAEVLLDPADATSKFSRQREVTFVPVEDPEAILRFTQAPASAPADNETASFFTVEVGAQLLDQPRTVKFRIDGPGSFDQGADDAEIDVPVGPGKNQATAIVYSPQRTGVARITASIQGFVRETNITFVRALPDQILVSLEKFSVKASETVRVNATLLREVGRVTEDTGVTFEARDKDDKVFGRFSNTDSLTNSKGEVATDFSPGVGANPGTATMFVRVEGAAVEGSAQFEVVP